MLVKDLEAGRVRSTGAMSSDNRPGTKKFLICAVGIFASYFIYGILQEKITRVPYGEEKEKFVYALSLVFVQCVVNCIFAEIVIKTSYKDVSDSTPFAWYGVCATTYLGAMLASNKALQWVNYPTQVLGKSCKPIPVMILGVLLARKRYPLLKYMCVFLIVFGVSIFLYKDNGKATTKSSDHWFGLGELLLLVSLTCDGLTGAVQDRMRGEHHVQSHYLMYNMNLWSIGILAVGLVATGEVFRFLVFCEKYPTVLINMMMFSLTSAIGQNFIFMAVADFGPLACSIITTTRKFFTILASVLLFGNTLLGRQWLGVILVFVGLSFDSYISKYKKK